jgi:hypothetical protein
MQPMKSHFRGMNMNRRKPGVFLALVLFMVLVASSFDVHAASKGKGQTLDPKIPCDDPGQTVIGLPKASVAVQVGRCFLDRGQNVQAARYLRGQLLEMEREGKKGGRAALESLMTTVTAKIGELDVKSSRGAEVFVDGRSMGDVAEINPVFVDPGPHVIEARQGKAEARKNIEVNAGDSVSIELTIIPKKPDRPKLPPPKTDPWRMPVMLAGGGVGLMGVIVGAFEVSAARQAEERLQNLHVTAFPEGASKCVNVPAVKRCREEAGFMTERDRSWQLAGLGFTLAGLGVATVAIAAFWPKPKVSARKTEMGLNVTYASLPGGGTMTVQGKF